jgi:uncharacterized protein YbjT (DUF2867 family)
MILVTGATGNVGRQVVSQLQGTGARVLALTRNSDSAALPREVDVVRGDLTAPATLDGHLDGVEVTGAPAHTFCQWAIDHAGEFCKRRAQ